MVKCAPAHSFQYALPAKDGSLHRGRRREKIQGMRGPAITLQCDCGAEGRVPFGGRWACPECGRSYDTTAIPAGEYERIVSAVRSYRIAGFAMMAVIAAMVLALALSHRPVQIFAGLPLILLVWFMYVRPVFRRRYRRAIADVPTWQLHSEPVGDK